MLFVNPGRPPNHRGQDAADAPRLHEPALPGESQPLSRLQDEKVLHVQEPVLSARHLQGTLSQEMQGEGGYLVFLRSSTDAMENRRSSAFRWDSSGNNIAERCRISIRGEQSKSHYLLLPQSVFTPLPSPQIDRDDAVLTQPAHV